MERFVTIRNGASALDIRLSMIDEWPMANWDGAMSLMVKGGWLNDEAVRTLSEWFPAALEDAAMGVEAAKSEFELVYLPLEKVPQDLRWLQKTVNKELTAKVREARSKEEKLKRRYLKFMAAKVNYEKEKN